MTTDIQPHIRLGKEDNADYAVLPGDPQRVDKVKNFLDNPQEIAHNREFKTVSGYYKGVKVLVTSTGIGGASTGIAVEELRKIGVKNLIRIGSCGALQDYIKLGDLIIATGAVRDDGASNAYIDKSYPAVPDPEILHALMRAAKRLKYTYHYGKIRSHDSFYTDKEKQIDNYWSEKGILGADMETSALFVIGGLRNIKAGSILNVVVESNGNLEGGINDYVDENIQLIDGEEKEIITALEAIVELNNNLNEKE